MKCAQDVITLCEIQCLTGLFFIFAPKGHTYFSAGNPRRWLHRDGDFEDL